MRKRLTVSLIIIFILVFMIVDFRINGVRVFEDYARQMETESMRKLNEGRSFNFRDGTPEGEVASRDRTKTIDARGLNRLLIDNGIGSVIVAGEDRDDIILDYKVSVYTDSAARSRELVDVIDIKQGLVEEGLAISLEKAGLTDDIKAVKIDYRVRVPREMELYINNAYGPLTVKDIEGNIKLNNRYDQLRAENIGGKADINSRYGYLYLDGIADETVVTFGYNNAEINNLQSRLSLKSDYGRVQLTDVAGPVEAEFRYGVLQFAGLEESLRLNARYTEVNGKGPGGETTIDFRYGGLNLNNLRADIRVNSRYTDLNINLAPDLIDAGFDLQSEHGSITTNLPLDVEEDDFRDSLQGKIGEGTVRVELRTDYGDIKLLQ